jgi:hypothetical protein
MDSFNIFSTSFRENPDYNYEDALAEAEMLFARQKAIQKFSSGNISLFELLAILESQGFSPDDYVEAVDHNLEIVGF